MRAQHCRPQVVIVEGHFAYRLVVEVEADAQLHHPGEYISSTRPVLQPLEILGETPPHGRPPLQHTDAFSPACQGDGRGKTRGAGTDYHTVAPMHVSPLLHGRMPATCAAGVSPALEGSSPTTPPGAAQRECCPAFR